MINKKLCFIGGGNMAEAMIKGLLDKEVAEVGAIVVSEPRKDRRQHLSSTYKVLTVAGNKAAMKKGEIIVLAVKPQVMPGVLEEIAPLTTSQHVVVSIAAGISTSLIASFLGKEHCIIRAMPNTPAQIRFGATALCGSEGATPDALHLAQALFDAIGVTVLVNEAHMDAVTGLSGSGPAYVFLIIEALTDGGVKMGLPRDVAQLLALQTIIGASRMVIETGKHPGQLKDLVTSPGGTTIRGLHVLEKKGVRAALVDAVEKATERSRELAQAIKRES
jgi:pyrroline-5-carboxylate reductase